MQNDYIAPVDHGVISASTKVLGGTAKGAVKQVVRTSIYTMAINILAGALIGVGLAAGVAVLATGGIAAAFTGWPVLATAAMGVLGSAGGVVGGVVESLVLAPISALFGAVKGTERAQEQVALERGQAKVMEMQIAAYKAMGPAAGNRYNFPAYGSALNAASPQIQAATAQDMGTLQSQQLARA